MSVPLPRPGRSSPSGLQWRHGRGRDLDYREAEPTRPFTVDPDLKLGLGPRQGSSSPHGCRGWHGPPLRVFVPP